MIDAAGMERMAAAQAPKPLQAADPEAEFEHGANHVFAARGFESAVVPQTRADPPLVLPDQPNRGPCKERRRNGVRRRWRREIRLRGRPWRFGRSAVFHVAFPGSKSFLVSFRVIMVRRHPSAPFARRDTSHQSRKVFLDLVQRPFERRGTCDTGSFARQDHPIPAGRLPRLRQPERLATEPLEAVAHDRDAEASADRKPEPAAVRSVGHAVDDQTGAGGRVSMAEDRFVVTPPAKPFGASEAAIGVTRLVRVVGFGQGSLGSSSPSSSPSGSSASAPSSDAGSASSDDSPTDKSW